MATLLPILAFAGAFAYALSSRSPDSEEPGVREALLSAALLCSGWVAAVAEIASLFRGLTTTTLTLAWGLAALVCLSLAYARRGRIVEIARAWRWPRLGFLEVLLLSGVGIFLILLFLIARISTAIAHDAGTYHLPRVVHWIQNASIGHFPTTDARQLYHPPLMEVIDLHIALIGGGRLLVAGHRVLLVIGCLVGSSLIVRDLGGGRRAQWLSAVSTISIPMLLLQVSGGKNDLYAGFYLLAFAHFALKARGGLTARDGVHAGLALGLAMLTKLTAYFIAFPFGVVLLFQGIRRRPVAWQGLLWVACIPLLLNAGHWARNLDVYEHPFAPKARRESLGTRRLGPAVLASNVVRGAAVHVATSNDEVNLELERAIEALHRIIGIDMHDPSTTLGKGKFKMLPPSYGFGRVANPAHLALISAGFLALLAFPPWRRNRALVQHALAWLAAFFFFSGMLQWQQGISRLQLPLFMLACPMIGMLVSQRWVAAITGPSLLIMAWPFVISPTMSDTNTCKPYQIVDPIKRLAKWEYEDFIFRNNRALEVSAQELAPHLAGKSYERIGLYSESSVHSVGPILQHLNATYGPLHTQYVNVPGPSRKLYAREPFSSFVPQAILVFHNISAAAGEADGQPFPDAIDVSGRRYQPSFTTTGLALYEP